MTFKPKSFISQAVEVHFLTTPAMSKKPGCPDGFTWQGDKFDIIAVHSEWHEYDRKGNMAHNMRETHAKTAARRGSWGVGQDYYRVETKEGRFFDLYFDRAPKNVDNRTGGWFLDREMTFEKSEELDRNEF